MADRPAMQLYFGDWKKNEKLRFCSWGARGAWIEVMGLMHASDEYGILRQPLKKIAAAIGAPTRLLNELVEQKVMKGCAEGLCAPYEFRPKHGRVLGDPVLLVPAQNGPIWYSSRMVRDEYVRTKRGENSRFGTAPKHPFGDVFGDDFGSPPNGPPTHHEGDGSSSSSSSSSSGTNSYQARMESPEHADERARVVVQACIALRKLGMFDVQPQRPELIDLASRGCTVAQMALTAAELALKKAGMHNDSDLHPELLELFANGRPQQELMLTTEQYTRLRNSAPKLPYLHKTLIGRAEDAARNGDSHANAEAFSAAIQAPYANVQRGGQRDRSESAASRAERARRAGDAREEDALRGSSGFEPA